MLKRSIGIAILAILLLSLAVKSAFAQPELTGNKRLSTNWSGYMIHTPTGTVTEVQGEWEVPKVICTSMYTTAAIWVGIDDGTAGTVEQIGVDADCWQGEARYYAWYDMFPASEIGIYDMSVNPGNKMFADVSFKNGMYTLMLTNLTTDQTFSVTVKGDGRRSTAEWVAEARWGKNVLPFSNVGTVSFSNAYATVKGHMGSINDDTWVYEAITMAYKKTGIVKAVPSDLSPDGTSFSVTWKTN